MASTDAKIIVVKAAAARITFPIFDADGDLVTGATGLDSEVSKDAGTFVDCTNEAVEIASASGMYYLDLTAGETNADTVVVLVKTSTSGAKTTPIVLGTAARSINDLAFPQTTGRGTLVDTDGGVLISAAGADAVLDRVIAEPTSVYSWGSANLRKIVQLMGALSRNKITQTATTTLLRNDADDATIATSTVSDDGTVFVRGELT